MIDIKNPCIGIITSKESVFGCRQRTCGRIMDFEEIVRLDVEDIENWSVGMDIKILLKTVLAVFKGSGTR